MSMMRTGAAVAMCDGAAAAATSAATSGPVTRAFQFIYHGARRRSRRRELHERKRLSEESFTRIQITLAATERSATRRRRARMDKRVPCAQGW